MCTETKDARVHCTILNDHTNRGRTPPTGEAGPDRPRKNSTPTRTRALSSQDPTVCCPHPHQQEHRRRLVFPLFSSNPIPTPNHKGSGRYWGPPPPTHEMHRTRACEHPRQWCSVKLLRKEVIQPHLPVRLPCYDFVPIASPTFDRSPHKGWATGFGCYRLS